mgnify:CR=1 FL=1
MRAADARVCLENASRKMVRADCRNDFGGTLWSAVVIEVIAHGK